MVISSVVFWLRQCAFGDSLPFFQEMGISWGKAHKCTALVHIAVLKRCSFLILIVSSFCSCQNDKNKDAVADTDFAILNKSLSDEIDTVESYILHFDSIFKDHLDYIHDFHPERCNILINITIQKNDTLVDFFLYDTMYKYNLESVPVVGSFKTANGITIKFADESHRTRGVLYETNQSGQRLLINYLSCMHRPMVLRGGKLIINPPPLPDEE